MFVEIFCNNFTWERILEMCIKVRSTMRLWPPFLYSPQQSQKSFPFPPVQSKCSPFCRHLFCRNGFSIPLQFESKILPSDNESKNENRKKNLIFLTPLGWLIQKNKKEAWQKKMMTTRAFWFHPHSLYSLRDNKDDKIDQKLNFPSEWQRNKGTCHLLCNTNSSESIRKTKEKWRLFWGVFIWKIIFISRPHCRYLSALVR